MRYLHVIALAISTLVIFSPGVVFGGNQSRAEKIASCKSVPGAVAERRQATWKWQRELEVKRTPTQFRDRTSSSCAYLRYLKRVWSQRADQQYRLVRKLETNPKAAITWVFDSYANQALNVAWCESRLSLWAENGQYLGLFQMGSSERQLYGHGDTAIEQTEAAHRYFVASGKDWSPWTCKPW